MARGVAAELEIAQEIDIPYFLLKGRTDIDCALPSCVIDSDKIYDCTWPNLKALIGGER
jgi:hypothetical protein